ncbi:MAG: type II toxin-antitoxin system prevent-host-death family antitoxin [Actinomycetota bacterium]
MRVGIAELRRDLKHCLEVAASGEEVVVTDRGKPVARITGIDSAAVIEELYRSGVVSRPQSTERFDPGKHPPIVPKGSVSELVKEQRR